MRDFGESFYDLIEWIELMRMQPEVVEDTLRWDFNFTLTHFVLSVTLSDTITFQVWTEPLTTPEPNVRYWRFEGWRLTNGRAGRLQQHDDWLIWGRTPIGMEVKMDEGWQCVAVDSTKGGGYIYQQNGLGDPIFLVHWGRDGNVIIDP